MLGVARDGIVSPSRTTRSSEAEAGVRQTFRPADRLKRRAEYREAQRRGERAHTRHFIIILQPRDDYHLRLGVTVSKKVGTAVQRNRVKRLLREVFRRNRTSFPNGCDVVIIAKKGAPELDYVQVRDELRGIEHVMHGKARRARRRAHRPEES